MATTSISTSEAQAIAKKLRDLIKQETIDKVAKLNKMEFDAGPPSMDAAQWLEAIVHDRAKGAERHLQYLEHLFESLALAIEKTATVLTQVDSTGSSDLPLNDWIDRVNAYSIEPPAEGADRNYESGDTGGGKPHLAWEIGPTGKHRGDDSHIVIDVPDDRSNLPSDQWHKEYTDIITKANGGNKPEQGDLPDGVLYVGDSVRVNESDPEDGPKE